MDDLATYLRSLISERHPISSPAGLRRAQDYLADQFRRIGLEVSFHQFRALGGTYKNVIAALCPQQGSGRRTGPPLIIAAHYDTVEGSPGADDNASGVAALLEISRAFVRFSCGRSVRLVAFVNEEPPFFYWDQMGSTIYAKAARARGDSAVADSLLRRAR